MEVKKIILNFFVFLGTMFSSFAVSPEVLAELRQQRETVGFILFLLLVFGISFWLFVQHKKQKAKNFRLWTKKMFYLIFFYINIFVFVPSAISGYIVGNSILLIMGIYGSIMTVTFIIFGLYYGQEQVIKLMENPKAVIKDFKHKVSERFKDDLQQ